MAPSVIGTPTVTHASGANTTTPSGTVPAGVATDEYLLAAIHARNQSAVEPTEASFTSSGIATGGAGVGRLYIQYHKVTNGGSEPASYTFTSSTSTRWSIAMVRISGADLTTFLDGALQTQYNATADTTIELPAKTPTDGTRLVMYFGAQGDTGTVSDWGGLTSVFEGTAETSTNARTIIGASGSGSSATVTVTGTQSSTGAALSINPGAQPSADPSVSRVFSVRWG